MTRTVTTPDQIHPGIIIRSDTTGAVHIAAADGTLQGLRYTNGRVIATSYRTPDDYIASEHSAEILGEPR